MATPRKNPVSALEEDLLKIIRTLPPRRAAQVLDFARWLQTQPALDEPVEKEITQAELEQEEAAWEEAYLAHRDDFREMARQALRDLEAGDTLEMLIENGKIVTR